MSSTFPDRFERWVARTTGHLVATDWFDRLARFGYASKGAVFGTVGALAIARGLGAPGEAEDAPGAIEAIREVPLHQVLLVLLALGLTGYAIWRVVQAVLDAEGEGGDWLGLTKRGIYLAIGVFYGYLAFFAAAVIAGMRSDGDGVQDFTATVLGWPGGRVVVGVVGLGVVAAGLNEVLFALRGRFRQEFERRMMRGWERVVMNGVGWWGHAGRGLVYGLIGYLVIRSAVAFDASEAAGLAEAFRALEQEGTVGRLLVLVAGVAFLSFGLYCLLLALRGEIENEAAVHGSLEEAVTRNESRD